jgi:Flp pilus assembly protein TadG
MRAGVTPIITPPRQARAADRPPSRERAMSQPDRERGSLILMLAVIDGGAQLTAAENAAAIAQEAARAGAGQVDTATAHENGSFVISEDQAIAAADAYLSGAGYHGVVQPGPGGTDEIEVTVMVTEPTRVLSIIGIDTLHATGRATANLVSGVTGPGQ